MMAKTKKCGLCGKDSKVVESNHVLDFPEGWAFWIDDKKLIVGTLTCEDCYDEYLRQ